VDPVLLAELGLVLVLLARVPHLVVAVGKLTLRAVQARPLLLEVAADLRLEARIGRVVVSGRAGAQRALPFVVFAAAVDVAAAN